MKNFPKVYYLDILQIYRGLAALMVVCHHTVISIIFYHKINIPFFYYLGIIGKYGVDFFFVLSGFIISYASYFKYSESNSLKNYLKNRFLRIYIPYLPIGIFMFILYYYFPHFSNSTRAISAISSFTLIPNGNPALSVAWTLTFELCFYLLFSISFFSKKVWNYFIVAWFLLIVVFNYSLFKSMSFLKNPFFQVVFSSYNFEFILGYILSLVIIHKKKINLYATLTIIIPMLLIFVLCIIKNFTFFYFSSNIIFAIAVFFIIYAAINFSKKK